MTAFERQVRENLEAQCAAMKAKYEAAEAALLKIPDLLEELKERLHAIDKANVAICDTLGRLDRRVATLEVDLGRYTGEQK